MIIDKAFLLSVALPLAEAAYTVVAETPVLPAGYALIRSIQLDRPLGKISPDNPYFGFVATAGNVVYIAIRGTQTPDEWVDDFESVLEDVGGFKVHAGFQRLLELLLPSIRAAIAPTRSGMEFCVIGHSLGAAAATLVAASIAGGTSLPVTCIVFASPRVGDVAWKAHCDENVCLVRVSNTRDIVTHIPPRPEFIHAGMAAVFNGWLNAINVGQALDVHFEHSLSASYRPGIAKMLDSLALIDLT
jgi:predicted lipase